MNDLAEQLTRIEEMLVRLASQKLVKEMYTTAEAARIVGRKEYTVREYCRKGQVKAERTANGRGWLIPHDELERLRNYGPRADT